MAQTRAKRAGRDVPHCNDCEVSNMHKIFWKFYEDNLYVNYPDLTNIKYFRIKYGYNWRRYKSPSFCHKCGPWWFQEIYGWGHEHKNCLNLPLCEYHNIVGHIPTYKCMRWCFYKKFWHNMRSCRKLKTCNLCGTLGH